MDQAEKPHFKNRFGKTASRVSHFAVFEVFSRERFTFSRYYQLQIEAFADVDRGGSLDDRRSISGYYTRRRKTDHLEKQDVKCSC